MENLFVLPYEHARFLQQVVVKDTDIKLFVQPSSSISDQLSAEAICLTEDTPPHKDHSDAGSFILLPFYLRVVSGCRLN